MWQNINKLFSSKVVDPFKSSIFHSLYLGSVVIRLNKLNDIYNMLKFQQNSQIFNKQIPMVFLTSLANPQQITHHFLVNNTNFTIHFGHINQFYIDTLNELTKQREKPDPSYSHIYLK